MAPSFHRPIALPARLRCDRCSVIKASNFFSARQRDQATERLQGNPRLDPTLRGIATCLTCGPMQVSELECQGCDRWLPLDRFSGAMRRTPDDALCWTCSAERQNLEPGSEDPEADGMGFRPAGEFSSDEDSDDDDDGDGAGGRAGGVGASGSTFSGMTPVGRGMSSSAASGVGSAGLSMSVDASTGGVRLASERSTVVPAVLPSSSGWTRVRAVPRPVLAPSMANPGPPGAGGRGLDEVAVEESDDSDSDD